MADKCDINDYQVEKMSTVDLLPLKATAENKGIQGYAWEL